MPRPIGASQAERDQALAALRALGFTRVSMGATSDLAQAVGTVSVIEADFGVHLATWRAADGTTYIAPDGAARLPATLAGVVAGVVGLNTRPVVLPRSAKLTLAPQQVSGGGLDPSALRSLYDVSPLTAKGLDGTGETIAVAEIDRFRQSDIATYDSAFALTTAPVQVSLGRGRLHDHQPGASARHRDSARHRAQGADHLL